MTFFYFFRLSDAMCPTPCSNFAADLKKTHDYAYVSTPQNRP